jgi:hypothetical protein
MKIASFELEVYEVVNQFSPASRQGWYVGVAPIRAVSGARGKQVKRTLGFNSTFREVYSRQIDPKHDRFHLSRSRLVHILLTVSPFLLVSAVAYYFVQPFGLWLSAACGAFLALWQVIFYGYARAVDEHLIEVTHFYSRRYLIFIGTFGLILIAWVSWRLWVMAPGPQS